MTDDELNDIIANWRAAMMWRERMERGIMIALTIAAVVVLSIIIRAWIW